MGLGPFDLYAAEFLMLYAGLGLIAVVASFVIPPYLRPDGRPGHPADEDELALLAGGRDRFAETAAARLLAAGAATVEGTLGLRIRDARGGGTLAERRITAMPSPASWKDVTHALAGPAETGERRLAQKGLLLDRAAAGQLRLIQTAPLALLFAFGLAKWIIGAMRDRPVEYLTLLLVFTAIAAAVRFGVLDRRTRAGQQAVARARADAARLRRAVPADEAALAVALFGTAVLAGSYLSDFHRMCSASKVGGGSSGDSGSSSSSDSGCGGGGCGGCSKKALAASRVLAAPCGADPGENGMRYWSNLLAASAMVLPAVSFAQVTAEQPAAKQSAADITALDPAIDAILTKWMAGNHVPGLVFGVVRDGRLVYVKGAGVQDLVSKRAVGPGTLFRIASMTKAFTAMAVLALRDEGRLSLDDPADRHVPELRGWTYPTSDSPRITLRDLLTHSAGFVTDDPWGDRQQVLPQSAFTALLRAGVPFSGAPEMRHEYANLGYAILGRVIANVTKAPYRTFVEQRLLSPLGMNASGFDVLAHPKGVQRGDGRAVGYRWENAAWAEEPTMKDGAFNAMGGLEVSAADYAKWLGFVAAAWPPRDGADAGPVKRGTVRQVMRGVNNAAVFRRPATGGKDQCPGTVSYGMGWRVIGDCEYGIVLAHGGGYPGYGSHVMVLPEYGAALFALTNKTYAGPSQPVWDVAALLRSKGVLVKRAEPVSPDLAAFYALAQGVWAAGTTGPLTGRTAMNFALDRTAANWAKVLAETRVQAGTCGTAAPVVPEGAMSGTFSWACEKGRIKGEVLLAPTKPITLQALSYTFEGKD